MSQESSKDQQDVAEAQSAHPVEPAEGAREPGKDAQWERPPHPVDPAEGARTPEDDRNAGESGDA